MAEAKKNTVTRSIAQYAGFSGTTRILTVADQNTIVGVKTGAGKEDLVWLAGNKKLDVTDVHPDVLDYLKSDDEFKVREVEVAAESTSTPSAS